MVSHMKTTLVIDDQIMRQLKEEAARRGTTVSSVVESALRLLLQHREPPGKLPELPSFNGGGACVDIRNRDDLYRAMEGD